MRLESLGARTWLLAVVAGWALLVWLLAVLGLGGRIAPPAGEGGGVPALAIPALPEPVPERLRDFDRYAGIATHTLFSNDRQPRAFQLVADAEPVAAGDVRLTGVLITPDLQLATLQTGDGTSLRLQVDGPDVAGWRLLSLQPRAAVVAGPGGTRSLALQTYHGMRGGQVHPAPAPAATPQARPDAGASPKPAESAALAPAATTQEQIEDIRQRIEERRRQLKQQDQGDTPASSDTP